LGRTSLGSFREGVPFEIETDDSDNALAAVLCQGGRPVAFMSRTHSQCEKRYPDVEMEATAVIEAVRKWQHFIKGRLFTIVTDQEAPSFMSARPWKNKKHCDALLAIRTWDNIILIFAINQAFCKSHLTYFRECVMRRLESHSSN